MPRSPVSLRHSARRSSRPGAGGFGLLWFLTIVAAFLYLSGAVKAEQHDALYTLLLGVVWGLYFTSDRILRTRRGALLMGTVRLLLLAGFFGFVYWIVLTHP